MSLENEQSTSSADGPADHAFLQHRIALFGLWGIGIGYFFLTFRAVSSLVAGRPDLLIRADFVLHAFGATCFVFIWLLTRTGTHSYRYLRTVESVGLVSGCAFYLWMGTAIPLVSQPAQIVVLALTFGLVARAVYVPSSAKRTLALGCVIGIPLLISTGFAYAEIDDELLRYIGNVMAEPELSRSAIVQGTVSFTAAWWLMTVAVTTAASRVIYGLRKEVDDVRKLGQYTLIEKLGEGGMGVVYRATHAMLRRPTAIKLLRPDKVGEQSIHRFEREVQLTARLTHPNTVTVFDYGRTPDGLFYYAMELLDGATLAQIVEATGAQPSSRVRHIMAQAASALNEAHGIGLIHRDIKPGNIMLLDRAGMADIVKVVDFGLVKEIANNESLSLTNAETLTGTPQYMSPEAIRAPNDVDGRSDIYALGAVAYYLACGEHVFDGNTVVEVCSHHLHSEPIPPSKRTEMPIDEGLEALILKCLAKDQNDRPQSAEELFEECHKLDVGPWTTQQANAWWKAHGDEVGARSKNQPTTASDRTIAIDLARRTG